MNKDITFFGPGKGHSYTIQGKSIKTLVFDDIDSHEYQVKISRSERRNRERLKRKASKTIEKYKWHYDAGNEFQTAAVHRANVIINLLYHYKRSNIHIGMDRINNH